MANAYTCGGEEGRKKKRKRKERGADEPSCNSKRGWGRKYSTAREDLDFGRKKGFRHQKGGEGGPRLPFLSTGITGKTQGKREKRRVDLIRLAGGKKKKREND